MPGTFLLCAAVYVVFRVVPCFYQLILLKFFAKVLAFLYVTIDTFFNINVESWINKRYKGKNWGNNKEKVLKSRCVTCFFLI